jgi:hypothetical protein
MNSTRKCVLSNLCVCVCVCVCLCVCVCVCVCARVERDVLEQVPMLMFRCKKLNLAHN